MRVRSPAVPIPTFATERAGRSRRWTARARAPIRTNGFTAIGGSDWGIVDHERTQCEPDWGRPSSPSGPAGRKRRLTVSSLDNPLFTGADVKCSQDAAAQSVRQ